MPAGASLRDPNQLQIHVAKPQNRSVKGARIGVWFSAALLIFGLSAWSGLQIGTKLAVRQHRLSRSRPLGGLSGPEHAHLEAELDELETMSFAQLFFLVGSNDPKLRKNLPTRISALEQFVRKLPTAEFKPVADMNLMSAYMVGAIISEEENNGEQAAVYISLAQSLCRSLGWRDCSERALKAFAQAELGHWHLDAKKTGNPK